jgi:tetratricopeptide (TPR) repeat protein
MAEVFGHNQMDLRGLALLALRMNEILADPEKNVCGAGELFGISRLLQKNGNEDLAGRMYQRAIDIGLPKVAEQVALRDLAYLAKRSRNYELSNELWGKLLDDTTAGLRAYEQLAMYYEHQTNLPEKAAELSREALIRLQGAFHSGRIPSGQYRQWHAKFHHRLSRLSAKTTRAKTSNSILSQNRGLHSHLPSTS